MSDLTHSRDGNAVGVGASALWLGLGLIATSAIVALVNFNRLGTDGLTAALVAGFLVAIGMFSALWITSLGVGRPVVHYALGATGVRLGVPVLGALVIQAVSPRLASADLFPCVLAIYLPALLMETLLAARMLGLFGRVRHG